MKTWGAAACVAVTFVLSGSAGAESSLRVDASASAAPVSPAPAAVASAPEATHDSGTGYFDSRVKDGFQRRYWVVGIGAEYFTSAAESVGSGGEELLGLTTMWRLGAFGPHAMLMAKPGVERVQDSRALAGLGLRGYYDISGFTEISYGVGGHLEARLTDHFWLGYLTPLELGAVVWHKGSWDIEAFIGVRRAVGGSLINYFLIDPNAFDNAEAQDHLDDVLHGTPWRAFVRVVFGRRVD